MRNRDGSEAIRERLWDVVEVSEREADKEVSEYGNLRFPEVFWGYFRV